MAVVEEDIIKVRLKQLWSASNVSNLVTMQNECKIGSHYNYGNVGLIAITNAISWHKKCGYASVRLISKLQRHNPLRGLVSFKYTIFCDAYMRGKQVNESFKRKNVVSIEKPLELLHIELSLPTSGFC